MDRELQRYEKENVALRQVLRETNQRLEEKIHEFSLFRIVSDTINRLVTKDNSLKLLLAKMIDIVGARNGSIMLIEEQTGQLSIVAASGTKDTNPTYPTFPVGFGVAGWFGTVDSWVDWVLPFGFVVVIHCIYGISSTSWCRRFH